MANENTVQQAEEAPPEQAPPEQAPPEHADVEVELEQGAPPVEELDPETRARRDAALAQVRKLGDPVLRASAVAVERFDDWVCCIACSSTAWTPKSR